MIIWGTTTKRLRMGRVADFCPICRSIRPFLLRCIRHNSHVYFIPLGSGTVLGHTMQCESCSAVLQTDATRYAGVSDDGALDLNGLVQRTHPDLIEECAARLEVERQLSLGRKLDEELRSYLIKEPFHILNAQAELRAAQAHFDVYSALTPLLTIALLIAVGFVLSAWPGLMYSETRNGILITLGLVGLLVTIVFLATDVRRFIRKRIQPLLVRSLQTLNPTREEITDALSHLKSFGLTLGRKLSPGSLYDALQRDQLLGDRTLAPDGLEAQFDSSEKSFPSVRFPYRAEDAQRN